MFWFVIGLLCLAIDTLTKLYIANNFVAGQSLPLIDGVFHITYHINNGAAFSILQGKTVFLSIASGAVVIGIVLYIAARKPKNSLLLTSLTLIIAGALGNLIDRVFRGGVIDFLDFRLINFPVFNLADCFVVIGGALLFLYILKNTENGKK